MKYFGIVYKITNLLNEKSYVGITTKTIEERFNSHFNRATKERSAIQKAMKKYGKENFIIEEIDFANNESELFQKEKHWISHYNTFSKFGYNLTEGGGGIPNMSNEIKNKISKSKTGKKIAKLQGRKVTEEVRNRISKTLGGKRIKLRKGEEIIILQTSHEAIKFGLNPSNVISCCKGKRKSTGGYTCQYINNANPDLIE